MRSLGDRGLAEEAVQETFVRAWRAADRFDDELGSLRTWLFAIVRNVVIDLSRSRAVRPGLSVVDATVDDGVFVDEAFERVLTAWQVEEALRMLSDEHRGALVEVHYKGRAYGEVAAGLRRPGRHREDAFTARSRRCASRSKSWAGVAMSDPCRDWRGALGAAALGEIDPPRRSRSAAHLDGCATCPAGYAG